MIKRIICFLVFSLMLVASHGQQYAVYADVNGIVKPLPNGKPVAITAGAGGAPGQIQWNNGGILGGFTAGQDATIDPVTGNVTIAPNAVTNSKLAQMPALTFKANSSGISASPSDLTVSEAKALLAIVPGDVSGLGTMATQNANTVAITGGTITGAGFNGGVVNNSAVTNLPAPTQPSDAARKIDVDNVASGIVQRTGVQLATTANITLSAEQTIDGVLTSSSRIMVKNQTAQEQNGIYVTSGGAWSRASDSDTAGELLVGFYYFVSSGATQASTGWTIQTAPAVLNTDPVVFGQFSASTTYTAGAGLALVGNTFSNTGVRSLAGTANEISVTGTNNATIAFPGAITLTGKTVTGGTFNAGAFNGTIGVTTPSSGAFTSVQSSGQIAITKATGTIGFSIFSANTVGIYSSFGTSAGTKGYIGTADQFIGSGNVTDFAIDAPEGELILGAGGVARAKVTSTGINAAAIGATTPSTGAFTTLSGSVTATGSVTSRTLATRFANVKNVKDFGAVGDGATNDTTAINAAIAALTNYSTLYFPAGNYLFTAGSLTGLSGLSYVDITGSGARLYSSATGATGNTLVIDETCSHVSVHNLAFVSSATVRGNGIHIRAYGNYTSITNNYFSGCSDFAIHISNGTGGVNVGSIVADNIIEAPLGDGVHVGSATTFIVADNVIRNTGDDGIGIIADSAAYPPSLGIVSNNNIYNSASAGIRSNEADDMQIIGNTIHTTVAAAIEVARHLSTTAYNDRVFVKSNKIYNSTTSAGPRGAINMYFCNESAVSENEIYDTANGAAIALLDFNDMTIRGNTIRGTGLRGIVTDDTTTANVATSWAGLVIDGNIIQYVASNESIYIDPPPGVTLSNMLITSNVGNQMAAGNWITYTQVTTGKVGNNTARDSQTVAAGGSVSGVTVFNNN